MNHSGDRAKVSEGTERSVRVTCAGYTALAEMIIGMIGIGALLDSPPFRRRPESKQVADVWCRTVVHSGGIDGQGSQLE